jgi:hypothetical protein
MQTFLPYPSFIESVRVLDYRRLGKQRVEAFQILKALNDPEYGWQNHPAVRMWRGHMDALKIYYNYCIDEWVRRGYKNTMQKRQDIQLKPVPPWFGDEAFHAAHRSNLLRKDEKFYRQYGWTEPTTLPYIWPTV